MDTCHWVERPLVGFDLETTGVDVETDRVVTANLTYQTANGDIRVKNFLLDPGIEIPEGAAAVHGISTEKARAEGMPAREGIKQILELLVSSSQYPIVAFNGSYDLTMMDREARRHGLPVFVPRVVIDPFVIDKQIERYVRGAGQRKLGATAARYGVVLDNAHSADADALATILIARAMGRSGKLTGDAAELHAQQIVWRAQHQDDFEAYLRKQGKDDVLDREWPVIPFREDIAA